VVRLVGPRDGIVLLSPGGGLGRWDRGVEKACRREGPASLVDQRFDNLGIPDVVEVGGLAPAAETNADGVATAVEAVAGVEWLVEVGDE
jgi:hypothetical protein